MDTSEIYIKMCEKAIELQVPNYGKGENSFYVSIPYPDEDSAKIVWLPRQDQLQEMILCKELQDKHLLYGLLQHFEDFLQPWLMLSNQWLHSFEQLWLAFVMKKKFNKKWNGEDWIYA